MTTISASGSSTAVGDRLSHRTDSLVAVSRKEWAWVAAMTLFIVGLTLCPPTVGRLFGPQDRVHVGTYWYHEDFPVYLAAMEEATRTPSWLVHNHMTSEPHGPIMMFPLYVLIGKISAFTGFPLLGVYAAVELVARCVLAVALYLFTAALIVSPPVRRFAFGLAVFSAGAGFWTALVSALFAPGPAETSGRFINLHVEAATLGTFLAAPHIPLGLAGILGGLIAYMAACKGSLIGLALLVACVLGVGLVHPFSLPILLAVFGGYVVLQTFTDRQISWPTVRAVAIATAIGAPIVIYNYVTFTFVPVWSDTFGSQNVLPSPLPWELLLDYGPAFALAPFGILALRGAMTPEHRIVVTWLAIMAVAIYAPVPYQRRFAFGAQPALAVLAALGWPLAKQVVAVCLARLGVPARLSPGIARRALGYAVLVLGFTTLVAAYFVVNSSAINGEPLAYYGVDQDTYALGEWIARHSGPEDVIFSSFATGGALGGIVAGHVYAGHAGVTVRPAEKKAEIASFYGGELSPEGGQRLLRANRVTYVVFGPEERKLGAWDPGVKLGLPIANRVGEAIVYRSEVIR